MYYILEIQEQQNGSGSVLPYTATTKESALSKWHEILMYAAISSIYHHTALVVDAEGKYIARESFTHIPPVGEQNG